MKREKDIHCCGSDLRLRSLFDEFVCHFPYAVFSLTLCLIALSVVAPSAIVQVAAVKATFFRLFHSFHYLHILFASAGAILTFFRYSQRLFLGILVGIISPVFFCMLSDIIMPYIGGEILGARMHLHICFFSEFVNVSLFLLIGLLTGFVLNFHVARKHASSLFTRWLHFFHILLSSMASMFYMVSHGFFHWDQQMGLVFVVLIFAVVVPCTLSDVVVPVFVARGRK